MIAEKVLPGMVVTDGNGRFKVHSVDHHVRVRNIGEYGRPALGKVWWRTKEGHTWIVECGSDWHVVG